MDFGVTGGQGAGVDEADATTVAERGGVVVDVAALDCGVCEGVEEDPAPIAPGGIGRDRTVVNPQVWRGTHSVIAVDASTSSARSSGVIGCHFASLDERAAVSAVDATTAVYLVSAIGRCVVGDHGVCDGGGTTVVKVDTATTSSGVVLDMAVGDGVGAIAVDPAAKGGGAASGDHEVLERDRFVGVVDMPDPAYALGVDGDRRRSVGMCFPGERELLGSRVEIVLVVGSRFDQDGVAIDRA